MKNQKIVIKDQEKFIVDLRSYLRRYENYVTDLHTRSETANDRLFNDKVNLLNQLQLKQDELDATNATMLSDKNYLLNQLQLMQEELDASKATLTVKANALLKAQHAINDAINRIVVEDVDQ